MRALVVLALFPRSITCVTRRPTIMADIRNFFGKTPPKSAPKSPTPPIKSPPTTTTTTKKDEDTASSTKSDNNNNNKKQENEEIPPTPHSPGRSPSKPKRKVHDININFSDTIAALTIKDAQSLEAADFEAKFEEIAQFLLNHYINEIPHRFVEVEFYYHGYNHLDTFAHCGDQQLKMGEWYFHKTGNRYRDGNYKGIDITFGDGVAHGGILIRSVSMLEAPYTMKCGPSLTVDHILSLTKQPDIPSFVQNNGVKAVKSEGEANKALYVTKSSDLKVLPVVKSIRVGLSMKRYEPEREFYFGKTYRYLTQPNKVTKGKHYMVVGMHMQKTGRADIATITAVAPKTVAKYVEAFDAGTKKDFRRFIGLQDLAVDEECVKGSLLGACSISPAPPAKNAVSKKGKTEPEKEISAKDHDKELTEKEMEEKERKIEEPEKEKEREREGEGKGEKKKKKEDEGEGEDKRGVKRKAVEEDGNDTEEDLDAINLLEKVEKNKKSRKEKEIDEDDEVDQEAIELLEKAEKNKTETEEDADALQLLDKVEKEKEKAETSKETLKGGEDTEEDEEAIKLLEKAEKSKAKKTKGKKK